jgi:WD40 repeat protein
MADTADDQRATADPAAVHVVEQWKHDSPLITCRFDPKGKYVFAGCEDFTIQRWDLATQTKVPLAGHKSWPLALAFANDGQTLLSSGADDSLIWWNVGDETPQPVRTIKAHDGWVRALAISSDGKSVATGGNDLKVRLWNIDDGRQIAEFSGHEKYVYSALYHPDGQYLLSGDLAGKVHQWELASGKLLRTFDATALWSYNGGQGVDYGGVRTLALSPDKTQLACGGLHQASNPLGAVNEPLVLRFDWTSGEKVKSHIAADVKGVAWRALFHPQGFLMGANGGSGGGWLMFWNAADDQAFHKFQLPNTARDMDLHSDGMQVATAHHDRHLRICRLAPKAG